MKNHDTISRSVSALAESIGTIVDVDSEQAAALAETFEQAEQYLKDNVADEAESAPRLSQMFSSPKQAERALACIIANRSRLRKSDDNLHDVAKECGVVAVAKAIASGRSFGISEHEFTELITEFAKRENPELTEAQAFTKVFSAPTEDGATIRRATEVIKAAEVAAYAATVYPMPR